MDVVFNPGVGCGCGAHCDASVASEPHRFRSSGAPFNVDVTTKLKIDV